MSDTPEIPALLRPSRRGFLGTATTSVAGLAVAGMMGLPEKARAGAVTDADVLNFALNLEYLEAEYYQRGVFGMGLSPSQVSGPGYTTGVISTPPTARVTFTDSYIQQYAQEIATDELNHVLFLRSALGSAAVGEPQINIGTAFDTLAQAAGIGSSFDPYSSQTNFLLGAFIFEDVGVTAYHGASIHLSNPANLLAAAGILGTEAYHASEVRTLLAGMANATPNSGIYRTTTQISTLRDQLDGPGRDDQGILVKSVLNIVPADTNSIVFARTTTQVLSIVYGNTAAAPGLFYPMGMNGTIR
jgi:hypothetical protein